MKKKISITKVNLEDEIDNIMNFDNENFKYPWKKKDTYFKSNIIITIKKDSEIIGLIICRDDKNYCLIYKLIIKKEFQRKGLGRLLIFKTINLSKNSIFHLNVRKSNLKATLFYKKIGFEIIEINENYYKKTGITKNDKTALKMSLNLNERNL